MVSWHCNDHLSTFFPAALKVARECYAKQKSKEFRESNAIICHFLSASARPRSDRPENDRHVNVAWWVTRHQVHVRLQVVDYALKILYCLSHGHDACIPAIASLTAKWTSHRHPRAWEVVQAHLPTRHDMSLKHHLTSTVRHGHMHIHKGLTSCSCCFMHAEILVCTQTYLADFTSSITSTTYHIASA